MMTLANMLEVVLIALLFCLGIILMTVTYALFQASRTTGNLADFVISIVYMFIGLLLLLVRLGLLPQSVESLLSMILLVLILTWVFGDHRTGKTREAIEFWTRAGLPGRRFLPITSSLLAYCILVDLFALFAVKLISLLAK